MKKLLSLLALTVWCGVGCGSKEQPAPAAPAAPAPAAKPLALPEVGAPEPAPTAETAVATAQEAAPVEIPADAPLGGDGRPLTQDEVNLLNYGIYMYKEEKGQLPPSLEEAVKARYIARLPKLPQGERFDYDPKTGLVKVQKVN
ncbi:MAG: hypothetical protein AB1705_12270 [Verrucomicrobiota bacterium]